jgi:hypothetical protein
MGVEAIIGIIIGIISAVLTAVGVYYNRKQLQSSVQQQLPHTQPQLQQPRQNDVAADIHELIAKVQSRSVPLAQCIAEGISIADRTRNKALHGFCEQELMGYDYTGRAKSEKLPKYRIVTTYISPDQINPVAVAMHGGVAQAIEYFEQTGAFKKEQGFIAEPVAQIESRNYGDDSEGFMHRIMRWGEVEADAPSPDLVLHRYWNPSEYTKALERIRREYTSLLLACLSRAK